MTEHDPWLERRIQIRRNRAIQPFITNRINKTHDEAPSLTEAVERLKAAISHSPREAGDMAFMERAACRGLGADLFFPDAPRATAQVRNAKAVCSACPVVAECREYAIAHDDEQGIWGGTTENERRAIRKQRKKDAA